MPEHTRVYQKLVGFWLAVALRLTCVGKQRPGPCLLQNGNLGKFQHFEFQMILIDFDILHVATPAAFGSLHSLGGLSGLAGRLHGVLRFAYHQPLARDCRASFKHDLSHVLYTCPL